MVNLPHNSVFSGHKTENTSIKRVALHANHLVFHVLIQPSKVARCRRNVEKRDMHCVTPLARIVWDQKGRRMGYSGFQVIKEGLFGQKGWKPVWRDPEPKAEYDAIIIGGGGHGLSTAFYLAKEHGMTNIAVLEKGYIGGGNVGRKHDDCARQLFFCRAILSSIHTRSRCGKPWSRT